MVVQRVNFRAVRETALALGVGIRMMARDTEHPNGICFRLTTEREGSFWAGKKDRVCTHGYSAFIGILLRNYPEAVVHTAVGSHYGLSHYLQTRDEAVDEARREYGFDERCACKVDDREEPPDDEDEFSFRTG